MNNNLFTELTQLTDTLSQQPIIDKEPISVDSLPYLSENDKSVIYVRTSDMEYQKIIGITSYDIIEQHNHDIIEQYNHTTIVIRAEGILQNWKTIGLSRISEDGIIRLKTDTGVSIGRIVSLSIHEMYNPRYNPDVIKFISEIEIIKYL